MASLHDVVNKLKQNTQEIVVNEVADVVVKTQKERIQTDVLDKYHIDEETGESTEPFVYERRYENGGLISDENIIVEVIENGITVRNVTKAKDNDTFNLAELIENGDGYNGLEYTYKDNRDDTSYQYLQPRPFIKNTRQELRENRKHIKALKEGLKNKGYNVR